MGNKSDACLDAFTDLQESSELQIPCLCREVNPSENYLLEAFYDFSVLCHFPLLSAYFVLDSSTQLFFPAGLGSRIQSFRPAVLCRVQQSSPGSEEFHFFFFPNHSRDAEVSRE